MIPTESLVIECQFAVRAARAGKIRLALDAARMGYRRAELAGSESDRLMALNTLAFCQLVNGAFIESMTSAMDAFPLAQKLRERGQAATSLSISAAASIYMLDTGALADDMLEYCLREALELADPTLELLVRNSRGVVMLVQKRFDESIAEFRAASALLDAADGTTPPSVVQSNIAGAVMRQANAADAATREARQQEARQILLEALAGARAEASLEAEARAHYALGVLHANRDEHEAALTELEAAMRLSDELTHRYRGMSVRAEVGAALMALQRNDEARVMIDAAIAEGELRRPCRELHKMHTTSAELFERCGEPEAAANAHKRAAEERESYQHECDLVRQELQGLWLGLSQSKAR
ncbi:MAG: hypothetical protein HY255_09635 [Betaproteobacteria bacterium]|nr:hypothetical protein [Betaproteobacteria bacterium]